MKVISLIPFVIGLIGFENCLKESPDNWKHGPEYSFRVGVNSSFQFNETDKFMYSNVTIILKCRPFVSGSENRTNGLQCYVKESQLQNFDVDKSSNPSAIIEADPKSDLEIGAFKFELLYDKRGLKEIKIDPALTGWRLNIIRLIASHLNFGFDKFEKGGERFAVVKDVGTENSTLGECETNFEVSKQIKAKGKQWSSKCGDKIYLEMYAYGNKNPMIAMDKTRNMEKCSKITPYFLGVDDIKKNESVFNIKMTSSVTSFFMAPHSFQSSSQQQATIILPLNETKLGTTNENICLYLENIEPASEEFKRIPTPSTTTMFSNDEVHKS
ncbi:uncharacterized protein [Chelonus insularis]|uniref:uncharacterized protein n=1 Tax=Chelonus insularis TaxID=460826 RepID=UPI00158C4F74|nr:uncharacterized protein LOC118065168 [Chelonus insularis]